jgi:hypothetical protein
METLRPLPLGIGGSDLKAAWWTVASTFVSDALKRKYVVTWKYLLDRCFERLRYTGRPRPSF